MRILVIATGGTIDSVFDGSAVNVQNEENCAAAQRYAAEHGGVDFDIIKPLNILSESVTVCDLNTLSEALITADMSGCDGMIITVGSDNLAYIASLVGMLLADIDKPVCLVAADKVLSDEKSNGYPNFCCAVELIKRGNKGVFVPYRNSDGTMYIHSATDIRQADLSDDFYSFGGACAVYDGSFKILRDYVAQTVPARFDSENLPTVTDNVLMIHPHPLLDYSRLRTDGVKAVLHTLYHSGTLGDARRFIENNREIPFYIASLRSGRPIYQTTADMIESGAIPLYDISPECAYMKLLLACAQDKMSIRKFMEGGL